MCKMNDVCKKMLGINWEELDYDGETEGAIIVKMMSV